VSAHDDKICYSRSSTEPSMTFPNEPCPVSVPSENMEIKPKEMRTRDELMTLSEVDLVCKSILVH
jgi:hypothetical protein